MRFIQEDLAQERKIPVRGLMKTIVCTFIQQGHSTPPIVIALTIGYLIHNVYRGIHILFELNSWERDEANMVRLILNNEQLANLISGHLQVDKQISWFIENCLHISSSAPIRERGYHLISRIHSLGGSILAILGGVTLSISYLIYKDRFCEHLLIFMLVSLIWIVTICLLHVARISTFNNYQILIRHFVIIRQNLIRNIAAQKVDPFETASS